MVTGKSKPVCAVPRPKLQRKSRKLLTTRPRKSLLLPRKNPSSQSHEKAPSKSRAAIATTTGSEITEIATIAIGIITIAIITIAITTIGITTIAITTIAITTIAIPMMATRIAIADPRIAIVAAVIAIEGIVVIGRETVALAVRRA